MGNDELPIMVRDQAQGKDLQVRKSELSLVSLAGWIGWRTWHLHCSLGEAEEATGGPSHSQCPLYRLTEVPAWKVCSEGTSGAGPAEHTSPPGVAC